MTDWTQPKTNWTRNDYINAMDFLRVFSNMEHIQDKIAAYLGNNVILAENTLTDEYALPVPASINTIERNLDTLRAVMSSMLLFPATETWPQTRNPDYTDANRWESFLWQFNQYLDAMASAWHYSGELFAG